MTTKFRGIKSAAEYRRGELARDILRLVAAGVVVGAGVMAPNTLQLLQYFTPRSPKERAKIMRMIRYLESRDCIQLEHQNGREYIHLTKQGRKQFDENAIRELQIPEPRRWDRRWRLVMFDLPIRHEKVRQAFRLKLEDFGFRLYQRSVFIYPHECMEEVNAVAEWFGVREHVRYIVAEHINDMRKYAVEFDLL